MKQLSGNVLPTAVAASAVVMTLVLGVLTLWEHEALRFESACRLRQARADVESAFVLYRLRAEDTALTAAGGILLHDSLPRSRVFLRDRPWGLYRAVEVRTADSSASACRLFGAEPAAATTLCYADGSAPVTLAGQTVLQGTLRLPRSGIVYGRAGSDHFRGPQVPAQAIRPSGTTLPPPQTEALAALATLYAEPDSGPGETQTDSVTHSFRHDRAAVFRLGSALIADCALRGKIILRADELHIDSTCRLEHPLIVARKIVVGPGARITAQLFARDTAIVSSRAVLAYPSGVVAGSYVEIGEQARIDGYVIVRDTLRRRKVSPCFRQARTARLRGFVRIDGIAQPQGMLAGTLHLRQAACFTQQGYYMDMINDLTLLENHATAHPLWLAARRRKEAACVD